MRHTHLSRLTTGGSQFQCIEENLRRVWDRCRCDDLVGCRSALHLQGIASFLRIILAYIYSSLHRPTHVVILLARAKLETETHRFLP
jgi:hypothetical protein